MKLAVSPSKFSISILLFLLLAFALGQDFDSVKIYINPGHGGHDPSDDRYISETGFWESESNLTKGLYLRDLLEAHNAVVFMSRTQNREEDDLPLSQIDADANANNVDYFHSIHSNAYNATINYPLVLFRGYDNAPVFPQAKQMGSIIWNEMHKLNNQWTYWGYSWENNRGDWSFYGNTSGLGVLRNLNMPGTLSEGSFHDYIPNSWRLMSIDYREHEAIVLLRSFVKYYDLNPLPTGVLAGIVRDASEHVSYQYNYNSGLPKDQLKTVDNGRVTLLSDGTVYHTDLNKNGFFMFEYLLPGEYRVAMEGGMYDSDTITVQVTAGNTAFANGFLTQNPAKPPEVYGHFPVNNDMGIKTDTDIQIVFSRPMDRTSVENGLHIQPAVNAYFEWMNDDQNISLRLIDTLARSTEYTVTIADSVRSTTGVAMGFDSTFTFLTSDHHIAPKITAYYPSEEQDSVAIDSDISITFDTSMRRAETEAAFSISPQTNGHFEWNDNSTQLRFIPDTLLRRKTVYTVSLSEMAQNYLGAPIDSAFQFKFITRQRNELVLLKSFPSPGASGISTRLQLYFVLSGIVSQNALSGYYEIRDDSGNLVAPKSVIADEKNGNGLIVMETRAVLKKNSDYTAYLLAGLKDINGLVLLDTVKIPFKTEEEIYQSGSLLDDFESDTGWLQPEDNPTSSGIDTAATGFVRSAYKKISGIFSGELTYAFTTDSLGVCRLENQNRFAVTQDAASEFGLWVFGDFSHNYLELWFDDADDSNKVVYADTINWAGWKLIRFPVEQIAGNGDAFFQSIVVRQISGADTEGTLYIDDIQQDIEVTDIGDDQTRYIRPKKFQIYQNYPNPFNPVTTFKFYLPKVGKVRIDIFNILGQRVETVLNDQRRAGLHTVTWDAGKRASGIYFYRIQYNGQIKIKKLAVVK